MVAAAQFEDVVKDYPAGVLGRRKLRAVAGVSFQINHGEVFGLLGPNRAGKTTLVKILLSLCRLTTGRVVRLGQPLANRQTLGRVGYMHENQAFPRYLRAADLLEYYEVALTQLPEAQARRRATALLEQVGLADRAHERIARFSKGMVQRLALAQALLNDPDLLVLDEPTEGLDLEGRQLLRGIVHDLRQRGHCVLIVSHVLAEVEQLCDRVAVLVQGQLRHLGPLAELTRDPATGAARTLEQALQGLYEKPIS